MNSHTTRRIGAVVLAAVVLGGAIAVLASRHDSTTTTKGGVHKIKAAMVGVIAIDKIPPSQDPTNYGGISVNVGWDELEPKPNGPLVGHNPIDIAIRTVRDLNAADQSHLGIRLRVLAGIHAPAWAKHLDGGPVTISQGRKGGTATIGKFWMPGFGAAYAHLESLLAARYDTVPEIREVAVARCMTVFAEQLLRQAKQPLSVHNLLAAGYTDVNNRACLHDALVAHQVWRYTNIGLALNPYDLIDPSGNKQNDLTFPKVIATDCRNQFAGRCILENNSIRFPVLGGSYPGLYAMMKTLGPPLSFQTAGPRLVGDEQQTLEWAISQGAASVETDTKLDPSTLADLSTRFAGNAGR